MIVQGGANSAIAAPIIVCTVCSIVASTEVVVAIRIVGGLIGTAVLWMALLWMGRIRYSPLNSTASAGSDLAGLVGSAGSIVLAISPTDPCIVAKQPRGAISIRKTGSMTVREAGDTSADVGVAY